MEQSNIPVPTPVKPPPPVKLAGDRRDALLAVGLLVLAVIGANLSFVGGFQLGFSISFAAILLCGGIYLHGKGTHFTAFSVLCTLAALLGSGVFILHNDAFSKWLTLLGMTLLVMLALVDSSDSYRHSKGGIGSLRDAFSMLLTRPFSHMSLAMPAIFRKQTATGAVPRRCGGILLGLVCAVPVLVVVIPLLVSADAAFEGLLRYAFLDDVGEILLSLLLGGGLFCILYSRWFGLRYRLPWGQTAKASSFHGLPAAPINAFLTVISGVYGLYLLSQLAYFFSAFAGILPEEYTVAQYARRGFFEMCLICAINVALVAGSLTLSQKPHGKAPLSTRLVQLFILLFSVGLVVVSLSKMALYIGSFGMTRLRLFTSVFMLMLGLSLLCIILRLFASGFPYMRVIVLTVACLGFFTAYADVDTVVARYNVTAYRTKALDTIDVHEIRYASDGVTPYLVQLLKGKNQNVAVDAANALYWRMEQTGTVEDGRYIPDDTHDWRAYNVDRANTVYLLDKYAEDILELSNVYYNDGDYYDDIFKEAYDDSYLYEENG